jgi:uncharacterized protein DUF262
MTSLTQSEAVMWDMPPRTRKPNIIDAEINEKYLSREWRIVTESNREQLPNFVEALKRPGWMELRPFYQRRQRWDATRQSRLIESFIINIPVPPLFVYESDLAKYEVMDGQQRITALSEFYSNNLRLKGLEQWPELNGRTYSKLPTEIRKGIDRRSISYTVLLAESAETDEEKTLLRQLVFERLNTGGVKLSQQEIRNCLYQGNFNDLLFQLAKHKVFRRVWGLPPFSDEEGVNPPIELLRNTTYSKMADVELALRFFALRHAEHYQRGMQGFLDLYMVRAQSFAGDDLTVLHDLFDRTIELAYDIYGETLFQPWKPDVNAWSGRPQVAFSDAVMVGLCRNLDHATELNDHRKSVISHTKDLFSQHEEGTFTGRGNSKADVTGRINLFDQMLKKTVAK